MAPDQFGRTIVDGTPFVNSGGGVLKVLENLRNIMEMSPGCGLIGRLGAA
jgi:hypothetical protein